MKTLDHLTTVCPFCGEKILTALGLFVSEDANDPRYAAIIGLKSVCECETAKRTAEEEKLAQDAKEREIQAEKEAKRTKRIFEASGMPAKWKEERSLKYWRQDEPSQREAYAAAVEFGKALMQRQEPESLYIVGDIGTGKTFLSSCLCADLMRKGKRIMWRNMSEILREIRACFNGKQTNEVETIRGFISPPVLVLDDLGKERPTEWAVEQLFSIINGRYDEGKPLIVTTNYGSEDLVKRLTPRPDVNGYADDTTARAIVDRLRGVAKCVKLEGKSKR